MKCRGLNKAWGKGSRSADYFLRIRNSLRLKLYRRCEELAHIKKINHNLAELKTYHAPVQNRKFKPVLKVWAFVSHVYATWKGGCTGTGLPLDDSFRRS